MFIFTILFVAILYTAKSFISTENTFITHIKKNSHSKRKFSNSFSNKFISKEFSVLGISHKNNSINEIEQIICDENNFNKYSEIITNQKIADEIAILSTCNRYELYACSFNATYTLEKLENIILNNNYKNNKFKLYKYENNDAFWHLCKVSSGLDSLIFGEKQIEEQIKKLFKIIKNNKYINLENIFFNALKCSKEIRNIKNFNSGDTSIVSACVDLIVKKNNSISILIVGSGTTSKNLINYLRNRKIANITITNHNYTNAVKLKNSFPKIKINLISFENFTKQIENHDYIFFATSSNTPLVKCSELSIINKNLQLKNKIIKIIDLSVPKNVDIEFNSTKYIELFDIDYLKKIECLKIKNNEKILNESDKIIRNYSKLLYQY